MTKDQMKLLMEWIEVKIDEKIEDAFGRSSGMEWSKQEDIKREIEEEFGFSKWFL